MKQKTIHWFRRDLRLADNPALTDASGRGDVIPVFILDDVTAPELLPGGASRWWLHHSLVSLNDALGGHLNIFRGHPAEILQELAGRHNAGQVSWNCCYEPHPLTRDESFARDLEAEGITPLIHNGSLLWDPAEVLKGDGTPYRVFTPFYKKGCLGAAPPRLPLPAPALKDLIRDETSLAPDDLKLLPGIPWDAEFYDHWSPGEPGAAGALDRFLEHGLKGYKEGRNFPAERHVSRLSPHLHWGEVSPNRAWYAARERLTSEDTDHFCSELAWREFSSSLLYHFPDLPHQNLNRKFDAFPWENDPARLRAWQRGRTGVPMVDAGMRELWRTGYMHNRVRMIVASFLVKNLLIHWRDGEAWFWDTLLDADLANNSASWQWVAGCGADAAPYFRIFNPVTQGKKFDPHGTYIRKYVPEISGLPDKYLFSPWEAPESVLEEAGIKLGKDYPLPLVDLKTSREHALAAYQSIKGA
jgi:deoxyribodipyrimidine photo-lyase